MLDEERRRIDQALRQSRNRDQLTLQQSPNARPYDLNPDIRRFKPIIIHFSGHGAPEGLCFMDEAENAQVIYPQALAAVVKLAADR